ncbi:putative TPX2 central domain-containing protein [Helianthus anomalus]
MQLRYANIYTGEEACTPKASQKNKNMLQTESKKQQTARRIASALKNPSTLKSKNQTQAKCTKTPSTVRRYTNRTNKVCGTLNFAQENQAVKRQKLEEGKTRQMYIHDHVPVPFVSTAEMMRKFQTGTRDLNLPPRPSSLSRDDPSQVMQRKTKLTLTRPKEPAFETSQRVRSVKLKSSAELEEEMMAKIPKFKARPLNKKILKAPTMKQSTPQLPEFREFHLETTERANQNAETSTVASTETAAAPRVHQWEPHLTTPKTPPLQTLLRARPVKIKSTEELEKEELENAPKFKARPLNKMIFESKGEMGLFCNRKRQVTTPQEFRFATDESYRCARIRTTRN